MITDDAFIQANRQKILDFKPKSGSRTRGLPVGKHFIITQDHGFVVYNANLRVPLIKTKFQHIIHAYEFCKRLIEIYDHLLHILVDENYAEHIFLITRYTINNGMKVYEGIRSFEELDIIKRSDLAFILDK